MREVVIGPQDALFCFENIYDGLILHLVEINAVPVPPSLVKAVIRRESCFNPLAVSPTGATGLGQFIKPTWQGLDGDPTTDEPRTDVFSNVSRIVRDLAPLFPWARKHSSGGDDIVRFVLGGYNLGPGNVNSAQEWAEAAGVDPLQWGNVAEVIAPALVKRGWEQPRAEEKARETQQYVPFVFDWHQRYLPQFAGRHAEG